MTPVDRVREKLHGVTVAGDGWQARCPAHEDNRASLSLNTGKDGRALIHCFAGCKPDAIVGALGLSWRDVMPASERRNRKRIAAEYAYRDEDGTLLCTVVRFEPKDFRPRRPDGKWTLDGVRRVPYRLPELSRHHTCFIPEGEKDVDALFWLGAIATCNIGGAGKWRADYSASLKAIGITKVVIVPDNDTPGREHAEDVARCHAAGIKVRILPLPNVPPKGDVSDWLAAGGTQDRLIELANAAPVWTPTTTEAKTRLDLTTTTPPAAAAPLGELLDGVVAFIRRFVVLQEAEATLTALWIAVTHTIDAFDFIAYLHITSPLPECGKTRTLEVLEALVPRPWLTGRVTAAVLMRKVDAESPVLLLDESDAAFAAEKEYAEALRGPLNSGFARTGTASACVGQGAKITWKDFHTFSPKAIAGIGRLPSTVESRSIPIALKRRTKGERVEKWRRRDAWAEADPIRVAMMEWASQHTADLRRRPVPSMPPGLSDRAEDVLEPLFLLADVAGDPWPALARSAAVALMGHTARTEAATEHSVGLELLEHIKQVFLSKNWPTKIGTAHLLAALWAMDDAPWATLTKGEKLTGHKLAQLLRGFGIRRPDHLREGKDTFRGYYAAAFEDAFARYLPSEVAQVAHANVYGPELPKTDVAHAESVPLQKSEKTSIDPGRVPLVPLSRPETKDEGDADAERL